MIVFEEFDPSKNYFEFKLFSSGLAAIDKFVQTSLQKQVRGGFTIAYVLLDTANNDKFVGFYTLTMSEVARDTVRSFLGGGSMPVRIGCARLGMLGVDKRYQKSPDQLGKQLLKHALEATKRAAKLAGCRGMYLDADAGAVGFYQKLGFAELQPPAKVGDPTPMFLPLESFF